MKCNINDELWCFQKIVVHIRGFFHPFFLPSLREDTHNFFYFFISGRTTKRVGGGVNPLTTKQKNCQNPFQAILKRKKKKKVVRTTKPLGGQNLMGTTTKKHFIMRVFPKGFDVFLFSLRPTTVL